MTASHRPHLTLCFLLISAFLRASDAQDMDQRITRQNYDVNGTEREALIYAPASAGTTKSPVVFVFHGHGGSAQNAARTFAIERYWPEAICVYMQGLKTPGRLTDPKGERSGWQQNKGHMADRDLKFFDVVLEKLRKDYKVDPDRVFATGHSNGGAFTYLLWAERGDTFAAVAPSAAAAGLRDALKIHPKPAMHLAGETDPLVKYEWQRMTINAICKINGCEANGTPWGRAGSPSTPSQPTTNVSPSTSRCTIYPSTNGTPVVTYIHPGGHTFQTDAPPLIVKFFKENPHRPPGK